MHTINISDFRANLLKYLEMVSSGEILSVTSNGKLLATVTPPIDQKDIAKEQLSSIAKTAKIHDVTSPTEVEWEASL